MIRKEIAELIANEEFRMQADAAETWDEVVAMFEEKGVYITEEDIEENQDVLLDEEALENVSGGVWHDYINPGYWLGRWFKKKFGICGV